MSYSLKAIRLKSRFITYLRVLQRITRQRDVRTSGPSSPHRQRYRKKVDLLRDHTREAYPRNRQQNSRTFPERTTVSLKIESYIG